MITLRDSGKMVLEKYPDLNLRRAGDYDSNYYIVEASRIDSRDYSDPYYLVSKEDGEVYFYNPVMDLDKFSNSMKKTISY